MGRPPRGVTCVVTEASFSPSALRGEEYRNERFTLGYSARLPEEAGPVQHLVVLQAQVLF